MNISNLTLGFVSTNTYFVENDTEMILIDPAGEIDKIDNKIKQSGKQLIAILLTHAHFDHIAALDDVLTRYDVPVYMHAEEFSFLTDPQKMVLQNLKIMAFLLLRVKQNHTHLMKEYSKLVNLTFKLCIHQDIHQAV